MAHKPFTLNKSTLGARAIFLLIKGSRAAVNAQDDSSNGFSATCYLFAAPHGFMGPTLNSKS
jgi:hypothetical protein